MDYTIHDIVDQLKPCLYFWIFFCNQEADDLCVRAANEKKFGLLDEANSKRREANEMREVAEQTEKAIETQKERLKNLKFF